MKTRIKTPTNKSENKRPRRKEPDRVYNVCAYVNGDRVMKETLSARDSREAIAVGKVVLRERGFSSRDVKLEAILLK